MKQLSIIYLVMHGSYVRLSLKSAPAALVAQIHAVAEKAKAARGEQDDQSSGLPVQHSRR